MAEIYNKRGKEVKKGLSRRIAEGKSSDGSFVGKAISALNQIAKGETEIGTDIVSTLQSSENNFIIRQSSGNNFDPRSENGKESYMNEVTYIQGKNTGKGQIRGSQPSETRGAGGNIWWNPSQGFSIISNSPSGESTSNTTIALAHELFHAYDGDSGNLVFKQYGGTQVQEIRASYFANRLRSSNVFGIKHFRTQYNENSYNLLNANGQPRTVKPTVLWDN